MRSGQVMFPFYRSLQVPPFLHPPHFSAARIASRAIQSFWPGLQALYGDVQPAAGAHPHLTPLLPPPSPLQRHHPHPPPATLDAMLAVMHRYKFAPEAYNLNTKKVEKGMGQYPLRPEVAESLFYLYQATGKEEYREAGRVMVMSPRAAPPPPPLTRCRLLT
jgi:hypothetical protein